MNAITVAIAAAVVGAAAAAAADDDVTYVAYKHDHKNH